MTQQKNAYTRITQCYDDVLTARKWWSWVYMRLIWRTNDNKIADEVLNMIPNNLQGKILDVPVGTAVFTSEKYALLSQASIVGVDYSQEMLNLAQQRKEAHKLSHLTLIQGDVGHLPFEDNSFDCILSMNGFHTFPDKEKAFSEVFRVLKPKGLFCGSFYIKGQRAIADGLVCTILNKKGLFIPPHYSLHEAQEKLHTLFGDAVEIRHHGPILTFRCTKPIP